MFEVIDISPGYLDSSLPFSLAFHMIYIAYKLNKQGDDIQPWPTSFPILNQSILPCPVLAVASCCIQICIQICQESGDVVWCFHLLKNFPQFIVSCNPHKGFGVVNKAEVEVFLKFSCFFHDPMEVGNLISDSSTFSKASLSIWKFSVHMLLRPSVENFEHYFVSMWNECNCAVVWIFSGFSLLWDWNENWYFTVLWSLLRFPYLLAYWVWNFHSIIF